jgi:hypothetical protein
MIDFRAYPPSSFWMRSVPFLNLRNLIKLMEESPNGLLAKNIVTAVQNSNMFPVKENKTPKVTTIYHYRNTLLHLGILVRDRQLLKINTDNEIVARLIANLSDGDQLSENEKQLFGELVLQQEECKTYFSNLFMPTPGDYSWSDWITSALPVVWRGTAPSDPRIVELFSLRNEKIAELNKENHIQAILYGVRYWFRNELQLIDELFREDTGNIMFPILPASRVSNNKVISKFFEYLEFDEEWARVSIRDLAQSLCIELRISIDKLYNIILDLQRTYPGYIVLIPTSRSFATITASSKSREDFELRSYIKTVQGTFISHLRVHQKIKEVFHDKE